MQTFLTQSAKKPNRIVDMISVLLIALFIYTAVSKIIDFEDYKEQMRNQVFPVWFEHLLIWTLPSLEIAIAFALFSDRWRAVGLCASSFLMTAFTIYIALVLGKVFHRVPCSCGGVLKSFGWKAHLFFNLFFLTISFVGLRLTRKKSLPH